MGHERTTRKNTSGRTSRNVTSISCCLLYSAHASVTSCMKADAGCHSGLSYPLYLTYHSRCRWKAPPPGTPIRHPHSEQRRPARAHAVGPVLGPHARTDRTRDTRDAEPRLPAPEDGRPGEGQRLTPGAPHNGGKHPPPGTPFRHPHSDQRQRARAHAVGPVLGPHARTDCTRDTRDAEPWLPAPEDGRPGEGQRLTTGAPHNGGRHPPPGMPFRHPHSEQRRPARAHAVGPVLGPHARTDRTRDTRDAEPWLPAPEDGRPGEGQRLAPGAPHNGRKHPPRGRPSATPTASNASPQGRTP